MNDEGDEILVMTLKELQCPVEEGASSLKELSPNGVYGCTAFCLIGVSSACMVLWLLAARLAAMGACLSADDIAPRLADHRENVSSCTAFVVS